MYFNNTFNLDNNTNVSAIINSIITCSLKQLAYIRNTSYLNLHIYQSKSRKKMRRLRSQSTVTAYKNTSQSNDLHCTFHIINADKFSNRDCHKVICYYNIYFIILYLLIIINCIINCIIIYNDYYYKHGCELLLAERQITGLC